jgi:hypothetical protein
MVLPDSLEQTLVVLGVEADRAECEKYERTDAAPVNRMPGRLAATLLPASRRTSPQPLAFVAR